MQVCLARASGQLGTGPRMVLTALPVEGLKAAFAKLCCPQRCSCSSTCCLEGHGGLVMKGLRMQITRVTIWLIRVVNLLTKAP